MAYILSTSGVNNTIIDLDDLQTVWGEVAGVFSSDEIEIDTGNKTIELRPSGNLASIRDASAAIASASADVTLSAPILGDATAYADGDLIGSRIRIQGTAADDGIYDITNNVGNVITTTNTFGETLGTVEAEIDAGTGVTGQCLYSLFKERWKNVTNLPQYDFPMLSITNEQFEFINGYVPKNDATRKMIRTAGWAEVGTDNVQTRRYSGVVSLGSFVDNTDQPYFAQDSSLTASTTNLDYSGVANEVVQIYGYGAGTDIAFTVTTDIISSTTTDLSAFKVGDSITIAGSTSNDGTVIVTAVTSSTSITVDTALVTEAAGASVTITADVSGYYSMYVRERGKVYADSALTDIGVTSMTYIVYRFPLTNSNDLKITTTADTDIDSNNIVPADVPPYTTVDVTYISAQIRGAYANTTVYAANDVVQDVGDSKANGDGDHWYTTVAGGTSSGATVAADVGVTWVLYTGEREVEADTWSAYTVIIDAENTIANAGSPYTNGSGNSKETVYEWVSWATRLAGTIDVGTSRNGNVADTLAYFVGDTLHTSSGVFVDSLLSGDANNVTFHDYLDATHTYPLTVTVTLNFNGNLSNDAAAIFYAYYKDPNGVGDGNEFGTTGALQVVDAALANVGSDVTNLVPDGATGSSYQFSYAYDQDTTGGRTVSTDTDVVVVAIGLSTGQYVKAEGQITNAGAAISCVASIERNYQNI